MGESISLRRVDLGTTDARKLIQYLQSSSSNVERSAAATALKFHLKNEKAVLALLEATEDSYWLVRYQAFSSLLRLKIDPRVKARARASRNDESDWVRALVRLEFGL